MNNEVVNLILYLESCAFKIKAKDSSKEKFPSIWFYMVWLKKQKMQETPVYPPFL